VVSFERPDVGWIDHPSSKVYLDPDLCLREVGKYMRDAGEGWPVGSITMLGAVLVDARYITKNNAGETTRPVRLGPDKKQRRVYVLAAEALGIGAEGPSSEAEAGDVAA
jgi:hypothetical protein